MSGFALGQPELRRTPTVASVESKEKGFVEEKAVLENDEHSEGDSEEAVIENAEDVAIEVLSTEDDPELPALTFRSVVLGVGLSAFGSVLATIYTFKPQNATVSQLFCLIVAYVLGTAMHAIMPSHGWWRWLNPGPFSIKEHTCIVIMASTASTISVATEIIAALDLFYDIRMNPAVAMFQTFATQMIGYGFAGILRSFLVYPTYAFYPTYISVVSLLQSLHFGGLLNMKKRRFFWIVFTAIFFWEGVPQYIFPLLTAISVICIADNGRHDFVRNLFGAGSSNEGLGLFSFSTSWTLITQGTPLVWPLQTQLNSYLGMVLGYIVLTAVYYSNTFNGRDLAFMSTDLFGADGTPYNQSAILTPDNKLDPAKLEEVGLPRYTATYATSQLCYNMCVGATVVHIALWHWKEVRSAFGGFNFLKSTHDIDDPHYNAMKKYREVPQWWYALLFVISLAVGMGCNYSTGTPLTPWWCILVFTAISAFLSILLGFLTATTGFSLSVKYFIQIIAAFIRPGDPITVMYANLYGNSTTFQTLYMLQDLKLGQYCKIPPRHTFAFQMAGSVIGSIFNYTMMRTIVSNNREALLDPIGTRIWSGWIIQQYNSGAIAMGALGKELFDVGKPYFFVVFAVFLGLFAPVPFWLVHRYARPGSNIAALAKYMNTPIVLLYIGYLPYSVNGQWWSCFVIGMASQWWARRKRPAAFKKYNYLLSAGLDGGSQVILFVLSFAVFGASGNAVYFPTWWGNSATLSVDRCKAVT